MAEQMKQDRVNEKVAKQTVPAGYKQTEVGVIPEDWVVSLRDPLIFRDSNNSKCAAI